MKRSQRLRWQATALMAAAALTVTACSSSSSSTTTSTSTSSAALTASAPGITATTITIGSHQPLTGPAAPGYSEIAPASNAYFQYVNANGGIYGRKIKYTYLDDAYNPTTTSSDVHQLVHDRGRLGRVVAVVEVLVDDLASEHPAVGVDVAEVGIRRGRDLAVARRGGPGERLVAADGDRGRRDAGRGCGQRRT